MCFWVTRVAHVLKSSMFYRVLKLYDKSVLYKSSISSKMYIVWITLNHVPRLLNGESRAYTHVLNLADWMMCIYLM